MAAPPQAQRVWSARRAVLGPATGPSRRIFGRRAEVSDFFFFFISQGKPGS